RDYLSIVRPGAARRRKLMGLAAAAACVLCFCAGRFGPWSGKDTESLTLSQALAILERSQEWVGEHRQGVYAVHRNVSEAIDTLANIATSPDESGGDASRSLQHLAQRIVRRVKELESGPGHPTIHRQTLDLLARDLQR